MAVYLLKLHFLTVYALFPGQVRNIRLNERQDLVSGGDRKLTRHGLDKDVLYGGAFSD